MPAAVCHGRRGARLHARGAAPAAQRRRSSARGATPAAQHRRPSAKGKRRRRSAGGAVPAAQRRRRSARGSEGELIGSTQRQSKTATAASRASRRSAATMAMMIFLALQQQSNRLWRAGAATRENLGPKRLRSQAALERKRRRARDPERGARGAPGGRCPKKCAAENCSFPATLFSGARRRPPRCGLAIGVWPRVRSRYDEPGVLIPVTKVYSSWLRRHPWPNG